MTQNNFIKTTGVVTDLKTTYYVVKTNEDRDVTILRRLANKVIRYASIGQELALLVSPDPNECRALLDFKAESQKIRDAQKLMPESQAVEYKSNIMNLETITRSLVGAFNKGDCDFKLIANVDDRHRTYIGTEAELEYHNLSEEDYIVRLRNHLHEFTTGDFFTLPHMEFSTVDGHRILTISQPQNFEHKLVLYKNQELYVRFDATNHKLDGEAHLLYIARWYGGNNNYKQSFKN